jgi:hypothetical protein
MTAYLGPDQAARLHEAERRWLAACALRLGRATTRPGRAGGDRRGAQR